MTTFEPIFWKFRLERFAPWLQNCIFTFTTQDYLFIGIELSFALSLLNIDQNCTIETFLNSSHSLFEQLYLVSGFLLGFENVPSLIQYDDMINF